MPTTIKDYLNNLLKAKELIPSAIDGIIMDNEAMILDMNRGQMLDGLNNEGLEIRPLYSQDPYFKTNQSAQAYIRWKQIITPNSKRNPDVPNLYINGQFHNSLTLQHLGNKIVVKGQASFSDDIDAKYKNVLGLSPQNQNFLNADKIYPGLMDFLKQYI